MSAIWGCVDFAGSPLPEGLSGHMEEPFHRCKIDRFATRVDGNAAMGCCIQYIHAESPREPLPMNEEGRGVLFTADCILDNRQELLGELCPTETDLPDGALLYLCYKTWGKKTCDHIRGSFAFAVYDREKNILTLCADHTYSRSLYYLREGSRVYFATLIEPILRGKGGKPTIDQNWLAMFLALTSLAIQDNPVDTPYEGVKRVVAGHYVEFGVESERSVAYWSPEMVKPLKLKSDAEYRDRFRDLMAAVGREVVRTSGQVGIRLSSGLDSTAVAAFAAPELQKQGKELLGYTCVPVEGYKSRYHKRAYETDERGGVESLCKLYPNIKPHYLPVPERNAIRQCRSILEFMEVPYKSMTNIAWLDAFSEIAAGDSCRVMLNGQMGNVTISLGDVLTYEKTLLMSGRLISLLQVLNRYPKLYSFSRLRHVRHFFRNLLPVAMLQKGSGDFLEGSYINREFADSVGVTGKDKRLASNTGAHGLHTFQQSKKFVFNLTALAHVTDFETPMGLRYGLVNRDITRDIRIFEFCLAVPYQCFASTEPKTRRLVRDYLDDKLPAELLLENAKKGRQSADWLERLLPHWAELYPELESGCRSGLLDRFIDRAKIEKELERFRNAPEFEDEYEFTRFCGVYLLGLFLGLREWGNL